MPKASFGLNAPSNHLSAGGLNRTRVASAGHNYVPPTQSQLRSNSYSLGGSPASTPPRAVSPSKASVASSIPASASKSSVAAGSVSSTQVDVGTSLAPSEAPSTPTKDTGTLPAADLDSRLGQLEDPAPSTTNGHSEADAQGEIAQSPSESTHDASVNYARKAEEAREQLEAYEAESSRPPAPALEEKAELPAPSPSEASAELGNDGAAVPEIQSVEASAASTTGQQEQQASAWTAAKENNNNNKKEEATMTSITPALLGSSFPGLAPTTSYHDLRPQATAASTSPCLSPTLLRSSSSSLHRFTMPSPRLQEPAEEPEQDVADTPLNRPPSPSSPSGPPLPTGPAMDGLGIAGMLEDEETEHVDDLHPSSRSSLDDVHRDQLDAEGDDMPMAKCSDCGVSLSIMNLTDHLCSPQAAMSRSSSHTSFVSPSASFNKLSLRPPPLDMPIATDPDEKSPGLPSPAPKDATQPVPEDVDDPWSNGSAISHKSEPQPEKAASPTIDRVRNDDAFPDDATASESNSPYLDTAAFPAPPTARPSTSGANGSSSESPETSLSRSATMPRQSSSSSSLSSSSTKSRRSLVPQPGRNLWDDEPEEEGGADTGYVTVVRRL